MIIYLSRGVEEGKCVRGCEGRVRKSVCFDLVNIILFMAPTGGIVIDLIHPNIGVSRS